MASIFGDDDDSDAEKTELQRRTLQSIRDEVPAAQDVTLDTARDDEVQDQLSEDAELERLRENSRYRQYAAGRKRNRSLSPLHSKRPRPPRQEDGTIAEDIEKGPLDSAQSHAQVTRDTYHAVTVTIESAIDRKGQILDDRNQRDHPSSQAAQVGQNSRQCEKARGRRIDPKIIDDSSDEDLNSDSSDEPPLGPALPTPEVAESYPLELLDLLPIQNEAVLGSSHQSYVSSIAIDRSGNRVVSGSIDSSIKWWDFNSMDRSLQSFNSSTPLGDAPVRDTQFSESGGFLLCSGGASSVMVLDHDGYVLSQSAKGDMYIVDMARTKGHTGPILSARWRPSSKSSKIIASASADGTIRLWDVNKTSKLPMVETPVIAQLRVNKLRTERGARTTATALDWTPDGKTCVVGCSDGMLKIIDPDAYSLRPQGQSRIFSQEGTEVTSVSCAPESCHSPLVLVRSTDDSLRVFDRRKIESPVREFNSLPNAISETAACFVSESGRYFMTGTSSNRRKSNIRGTLRMYDTTTLTEIWRSETGEDVGSVVSIVWHKEINQILYGCGDGSIRALYNPAESRKGVLQALSKSDFRKKQGIASVGPGEAYLPFALQRDKGPGIPRSIRQQRAASEIRKPKQHTGLTAALPKVSQSLAKRLAAKDISKDWENDPREAILRFAQVAEQDPRFTTAYKHTQPQNLLAEKTAEQEEEETRLAIYERDRLRRSRVKRDTE
eukprot:GFKZ01005506.1.p1 GENE.GFKZ01005506.1~~GFKZ01005506.1.p1  ORF type:complete len:722 (+),score=93.50 GFKZ01005506.1:155-2320(+)